ncbi:MAG: VCBS repeat-containing protein [Gemmataceae bacterium]
MPSSLKRLTRLTFLGAAALAMLTFPSATTAYVEAPMSLGAVLAQSSNVVLMRVEAVDKEKNLIIYRKIRDIKGKHPTEVIKHNIGRGGLRPNEWKPQMDWAEVGKTAIFFHNGGASETCIGNWWYQAYAGGEWWNHSHGEPFLLRSYCGSPDKLAGLIASMQDGKEVLAPCMIDGNKEDLHNRRAKIQRLKASLKLQDYNPKRDFAGWGGEDFRRVLGMPGFSHISALGRADPEARAISVVDFDADGKLDLCLIGGGKLSLLQNGGDAMSEISLPVRSGATVAIWGDYNCDGLPDLFLATPAGPKLFTNTGKGTFRDDSYLLPPDLHAPITAAAWLDYDGDGLPDLLVAAGYDGLRLLRNNGRVVRPEGAKPDDRVGQTFTEVSSVVGLGPKGPGAGAKGDAITVCDVDGDGRPDFLFSSGQGMLFLNRKIDKGESRFELVKESGIQYETGKIGPAFGDFDGDGLPDLLVPQKGSVKLFKNLGKGKFEDVTAKSGDLGKLNAWSTCAAWGDFDNDGHLDLFIGCLKGANRFFRGKGDGTFEDATDAVGLSGKIFNTQAISLVDLNNDGFLDVVFNNEGQDSVVLLGSTTQPGKKTAVTVSVPGRWGTLGSRVEIHTKDGKKLTSREISGGDGRGGQSSPLARFTLSPGAYRVVVLLTSGEARSADITVADTPVRAKIDE